MSIDSIIQQIFELLPYALTGWVFEHLGELSLICYFPEQHRLLFHFYITLYMPSCCQPGLACCFLDSIRSSMYSTSVGPVKDIMSIHMRGGFMQKSQIISCCSERESCNEIHSQLQTNGKVPTLFAFCINPHDPLRQYDDFACMVRVRCPVNAPSSVLSNKHAQIDNCP